MSNPAEKEKNLADDPVNTKGKGSTGKVQAHPIVGWKGFEDVMATIPGETVDIVQIVPGGGSGVPVLSSLREWITTFILSSCSDILCCFLVRPREKSTTTVVFFLGGCTYTEIAALRWVGRQNRGGRIAPYSCNIVLTVDL